jgi:hypothetical protein
MEGGGDALALPDTTELGMQSARTQRPVSFYLRFTFLSQTLLPFHSPCTSKPLCRWSLPGLSLPFRFSTSLLPFVCPSPRSLPPTPVATPSYLSGVVGCSCLTSI